MSKQREAVDAYAETHILEPNGAVPRIGERGADPLALYEEYARELARAAASAGGQRRSKRAAAARER